MLDGYTYSAPFKKKTEIKMTCLSPSRRPQSQMGTSTFLMLSPQLALSPQFASLVGAGIMLLLMMKMARFFYKLPNVSRPHQMPESDHIMVGASLRGTAFCSSPVVAPGYFWFLSFKITASTKRIHLQCGDLGLICGLGRSLGEGMATHSSILLFIYFLIEG